MRYCLALLFLCLAGCAGTGPYNTISDGADAHLMLKGADPVAYFTQGKYLLGKADIKTEYDGVTYRFQSEEDKAAFLKEPVKYVPQFGGFCSNGIVYGIPWGGDADVWQIIDGKLYIFGGQSSKNYFLMNEKKNLELSHQYWDSEVKGSNGVTQRYYRLAWRVPHYKTGAELAAEWKAQQGEKVTPSPVQ